MATMKAKNSAGEWVEVDSFAPTYGNGQLKIDIITSNGEKSFDLSKYKDCNRFILFYNFYNSAVTQGYTKACYDTANGNNHLYYINPSYWQDKQALNAAGLKGLTSENYQQTGCWESIFSKCYDTNGAIQGGGYVIGHTIDENYLFTCKLGNVGLYAVVIYSM